MNGSALRISLVASVLSFASAGVAANSATPTNVVAAPPLPAIQSLKLQPDSLTLKDGRDERRVLVWGKTDSGKLLDLTSLAVLKPGSTNVEIDSLGYIRPKAKGSAEVSVTAAGQTAKLSVKIDDAAMPPVR